jgi:membrane-bound lytic murein transglycosylase A
LRFLSAAAICWLMATSLLTELTASAEPTLKALNFSALAGWQEDDHLAALTAFRRSCAEILSTGHGFKRTARYAGSKQAWEAVCKAANNAADARQFFEESFVALQVEDPNRPAGLFTGYFEPEAEGSLHPGGDYQVPVYAKPDDLVAFDAVGEAVTGLKYGRMSDGKPEPYWSREQIEKGALKGRGLEIAWLKKWEDAFFIHIQGSGRIKLPDGAILRLSYAAKTGLPYTAIGGVLIERGILTRETNSMQSIRAWMSGNPQAARELMWHNKSFVFFRKVDVADPDLGALGAQQVHLTPQRSLAVDRSIWPFGMPVWIETTTPKEAQGGSAPYNRLMIAQDTGSAIKGYARGDVYWGWGETAADKAGHMKSPGRFVALLPREVAQELGLELSPAP